MPTTCSRKVDTSTTEEFAAADTNCRRSRYVRQRTDVSHADAYSYPEDSEKCVAYRCQTRFSFSFRYAAQVQRLQPVPVFSLYLRLESIMKQLRQYLSALFLAVTLVSVVGCASTSKQEGTGEYVDDSVITTKVKAAIFNDPTLKSAEINVETFKGAVQLSGFVSSQAAINKAAELARGVNGVKSVKNDMRIK